VNITGRELIRLLRLDGWTEGGRRNHGVFFHKSFPGESLPRHTVVPDKTDGLATGTLGAILGPKQTSLGSAGLQKLIDEHGRR
jgi:predicted RNA binding protein YcfA (HicA-like mRNA interferase family)